MHFGILPTATGGAVGVGGVGGAGGAVGVGGVGGAAGVASEKIEGQGHPRSIHHHHCIALVSPAPVSSPSQRQLKEE